MSRQYLRQSGAPRVMLLSAGLVFASGTTGWAADGKPTAPAALVPPGESWLLGRHAGQPPLMQPELRERGASLDGAAASSRERSRGTEGERVDLTASAVPRVKVRAGHHGEFERVAFEWPEAIEYDVVQHADQVTVTFRRPGRIDLSRMADHFGRLVLDAWAEDGEVGDRITLRVVPNARIRSFSSDGDRIVAIDVFGGTAAQTLAPSAPDPEQDGIQELRQALEQRDAAIESLLARVEQRDAAIENLLARVEQLERTVALSGDDLDRVRAGQAPGAAPPVGDTSRSESASEGQAPESPGARERQETAQNQTTEPGQFEIDEEAVERALDFTLVEEGALLLPVGRAEVTPSFTYTRQTSDFPVIVDGLLAEREPRRNEFDFFAGVRVGLPFDSQLELGLPYNIVDQSVVDRVGGGEFQESSRTGHGVGDFSVGLAKTMLRERNWWPDVVLRVNWDTGTGERDNNDVVLDGGFQELTGSISLAKRQDPLVFVAGAFYEAAFEEDDIDPGDSFGFNLGTFLAASPNTSLRVVLNQSFIDEFKVDGRSIDGSDRVQSILTLGASAILGRNVLLNGAVGVGLTDDSPDYSVMISLPIRFNVPGL